MGPQQHQGAELEAQILVEKAPQSKVVPRDVGVSVWKPWLRLRVSTSVKAKNRCREKRGPRTGLGQEGREEPHFLLC